MAAATWVGLSDRHEVLFHGPLERKQELDDGGRRSASRSWKPVYATLVTDPVSGPALFLFRDKQDFSATVQAADNRPPVMVIPLVNATVEIPSTYTKRKHVIRLTAATEAEFLFHTESTELQNQWLGILKAVAIPNANANTKAASSSRHRKGSDAGETADHLEDDPSAATSAQAQSQKKTSVLDKLLSRKTKF